MLNWLHPGFILILTGILLLILPENTKKPVVFAGPAAAVAAAFMVKEGSWLEYAFIPEITLKLFEADRLSIMFGIVFAIASLIAAVYSLNAKSKLENAAEAIYAGSSIAVVFSGDWISMIFFWEIMAVASWLIIVAAKTPASSKAGFRYLLVHMFGGNMLLAGIILKITQGSFDIECLTGNQDTAFWLILIGVAVNAAIPPLHSWIADAYPESTMGGTVYMGSFTTKVGVYCVIRLFAGTEFLLWFGVFMAIYGASMALIENDLRRLFAYHIVSQLGYMIAAAAVGSAVGIDGAAAHAFNHILYKGTLLMCAGAVITATGRRKISQLGGLYKKMPLVSICFLIASLAISGMPLLNGFVSKSLVMNAMAEGGFHVAEILLMVASAGTLLSVALKVNYFVFFGKGCGEDLEVKPVPLNMKAGIVMGAAACVVTGILPNLVYGLTPFMSDGHPFTVDHVTQYIQLFAAATVAFVMYLDHMAPHAMLTLDTDWFYRKPLNFIVEVISIGVSGFFHWCHEIAVNAVHKGNKHLHNPMELVRKTIADIVKRYTGVDITWRKGIEDDDVLQKPAGMLVATNMLIGIGTAVIAAILIF